jgi:hypothetical protein
MNDQELMGCLECADDVDGDEGMGAWWLPLLSPRARDRLKKRAKRAHERAERRREHRRVERAERMARRLGRTSRGRERLEEMVRRGPRTAAGRAMLARMERTAEGRAFLARMRERYGAEPARPSVASRATGAILGAVRRAAAEQRALDAQAHMTAPGLEAEMLTGLGVGPAPVRPASGRPTTARPAALSAAKARDVVKAAEGMLTRGVSEDEVLEYILKQTQNASQGRSILARAKAAAKKLAPETTTPPSEVEAEKTEAAEAEKAEKAEKAETNGKLPKSERGEWLRTGLIIAAVIGTALLRK